MKKDSKKEKEVKEDKSSSSKKDEKAKKLEALVASIRKNHGEGSVFHGDMALKDIEAIPTGSMILDAAAGIGGFPRGRIVEIYGPESSGKSTVCLTVVASAQKRGLRCAYVDTENALDIKYAEQLGVNTKEMLISQPDYAEQALDIIKEMAESGAIDVIVLDSVAALVPKAELEGEMGDQSMGVHARMMSKHLRVINGILNRNNCLGIFINQIRMKIGVMYGNPETTTGGNALKFYASIRLRVSKGETLPEDIGHMIKVKFIKNKVATPFTECEVPLIYGKGVDQVGDLFSVAKDWNVLDVKGGHTYLEEKGKERIKLGASRDETIRKLKEDKDLYARVEKLVREELKRRKEGGSALATAGAEDEDAKDQDKEPEED
jgi:recombination protein RecA